MPLTWLDERFVFPDPRICHMETGGLIAAGGDLHPERIIRAYQSGIFPWYNDTLEDGSPSPILWWCPQPRCVLDTRELKITKSLRKNMRNKGYVLSCDLAFEDTIKACASSRASSTGTWIHAEMIEAYSRLHHMGFAHSVECWQDKQLVGGLYGVAIGKMFFGESMFSSERDSSKMSLVYLARIMLEQEAYLIDCQVQNPHLASLGAHDMALETFLTRSQELCQQTSLSFPKDKIAAAEIEKTLQSMLS